MIIVRIAPQCSHILIPCPSPLFLSPPPNPSVDTTEPQSPPMPGTARGAGGPGTMTGGAAKVYKGPPVTGMGEKTAMSGSAS